MKKEATMQSMFHSVVLPPFNLGNNQLPIFGNSNEEVARCSLQVSILLLPLHYYYP